MFEIRLYAWNILKTNSFGFIVNDNFHDETDLWTGFRPSLSNKYIMWTSFTDHGYRNIWQYYVLIGMRSVVWAVRQVMARYRWIQRTRIAIVTSLSFSCSTTDIVRNSRHPRPTVYGRQTEMCARVISIVFVEKFRTEPEHAPALPREFRETRTPNSFPV